MLKKGCGCNKSANVTPELPKDWGIPKINLNPIEDPCKKPWDCPDIQPAVLIVNNPDNEDITSVQVGTSDVLKFADKAYDPLVFSGMGRVFLRKNLVDDNSSLSCASKVNKLELSMFEDKNGQPLTNTIFIVQYDYDLQGAFITIPCNSILLFLGGSFSNGTVILTNTLVLPHMLEYSKYMNCAIKGSFAKGQTFYSDGVIKVWNGSSWVEFAGSDSDYSELLNDLENRLTQLSDEVTKNTRAISGKIDKGSLGTINNESIEDGHPIIIEGGEGGGTISIPLATSLIRGGIKLGYQQNGLNVPVKLNNKELAYVTVPNQASSTEALNVRVGNLELSYSELILSNNSLEARVRSLTESISLDGTIDLTTLQSLLKLYVDDLVGAAYSDLTTSWIFLHGDDIQETVSGFQSMASEDSAFSRIFARRDDVEALVEAAILGGISSVVISANKISLGKGDSPSYIELYYNPEHSGSSRDDIITDFSNSEVKVKFTKVISGISRLTLQYDLTGLYLKDNSSDVTSLIGKSVYISHEGEILLASYPLSAGSVAYIANLSYDKLDITYGNNSTVLDTEKLDITSGSNSTILNTEKLKIKNDTKTTTINCNKITIEDSSLSTDDSTIVIGPGQNFTGEITVDGKVFKIIGGIVYSVEDV